MWTSQVAFPLIGLVTLLIGWPLARRRVAGGLTPSWRRGLRRDLSPDRGAAASPLRRRAPRGSSISFASAVMRALVTQVATFQLAALFPSDCGQALYSRLGWETWIGPLSIRRGAGRHRDSEGHRR